MHRLRSEQGFTLIELLVAMIVMFVVLSATLLSLDTFNRNRERTVNQNDQQEIARKTMDLVSVQLRNLANPSVGATSTITKAEDNDIVFQTTDPSKQWVRYCLDFSNTSNSVLYYETAGNSLAPPASTSCPTPAADRATAGVCPTASPCWLTSNLQVDQVTNRANSQTRAVFFYNADPSDAAYLSKITRVRINLFVDADPTRKPSETRMESGIYLRNQNQQPTSTYTATKSTTNNRAWTFNGATSDDPEGRTLDYLWFKGTVTDTTVTLPSCASTQQSLNGWTCMGGGALLSVTFPTADGSTQNVILKVTDPGGLSKVSALQCLNFTNGTSSTTSPCP
jgi:prepilin-type N-terminal cleavage/methylation domain-containing protein